jgi:hypothetical protein
MFQPNSCPGHTRTSISKDLLARIKKHAESQEAKGKATLEGQEEPHYNAPPHDPCYGEVLANYHQYHEKGLC